MKEFDHEAEKVTDALRQVHGYMACEKIIIRHILQHIENGVKEQVIEPRLTSFVETDNFSVEYRCALIGRCQSLS